GSGPVRLHDVDTVDQGIIAGGIVVPAEVEDAAVVVLPNGCVCNRNEGSPHHQGIVSGASKQIGDGGVVSDPESAVEAIPAESIHIVHGAAGEQVGHSVVMVGDDQSVQLEDVGSGILRRINQRNGMVALVRVATVGVESPEIVFKAAYIQHARTVNPSGTAVAGLHEAAFALDPRARGS